MRESSTLAPTSPSQTELLWLEAPSELTSGPADVHVFAMLLDDPGTVDYVRPSLSKDEKARATRFHFELHRHRFIAGRGMLRNILGRYLRISPGKIGFKYGPFGKPSLDPACTRSDLRFNLAHSNDLALLAVSRAGDVGIDVEALRPMPDAEQLVSRFFSAREADLFAEVHPDLKSTAFFNLWTRKEAWLKATGEGIAHSLNLVEVSFLPQEPARLLKTPDGHPPACRWTLQELHPAPGFAAALAVASFPIQLRCFSWPTQSEI